MNGALRVSVLAVLWVMAVPDGLRGQRLREPTPRQHERAGRYEEAARGYQITLDHEPTNLSGLLGLERVMTRLERLESLHPYLTRAVAAAPRQELIREIEFRTATAIFGADSATAVVARWKDALPLSANPYRQYAFWLSGSGDVAGALRVLEEGDARIGSVRLAQYRAQILITTGDWVGAAREWRQAVDADQTFGQAAGASLSRAPHPWRDQVLRVVLDQPSSTTSQLLAADLLVRWGRPEEGWTLLDDALPDDGVQAAAMLGRFAARAGQLRTLAGHRARAYALERLIQWQGGAVAAHTRVEAARAFADAGDLRAAQRLLNRSTLRSGADGDDPMVTATLIRVLTDAGRLEEAEQRFHEWEARLRADDADNLGRRLAWAWVLRTNLDRAEAILEDDSSVAAEAVLGWIALYRGNLAEAKDRFGAAGPYARSRVEATRRAAALVLLQRIQLERSSDLGTALLDLARGDTTGAVRRLRVVAASLPRAGGRVEVLALAGELLSALHEYEAAAAVLREAIAADSLGPAAPAAELVLATALATLGRNREAVAHLEHLILTYRESAVVPRARRLLDRVREMTPQ